MCADTRVSFEIEFIDDVHTTHVSARVRVRTTPLCTPCERPFSFWSTVLKRFALRYRRCLSVCLSVTLVYCDQTVGWISKVYVDLYSALS